MLTYVIIAVSALLSIYCFSNRAQFEKLMFAPSQIDRPGEYYRFITHGFIHADWAHLLINMLVLFSFGQHAESVITLISGPRSDGFFYLLLYLGGMIIAAVPSFIRHRHNPHYRAVGASGAIASLLFFFILFNPLARFYLHLPAFIFGILYLLYEYYMDKRAGGNIAHDAHFWGAVFGVVFAVLYYPPVVSSFFQQITGFLSF